MRKRKQRKNRVTGKATGKEKGEKKQRKGKWDFTYNSLKKKRPKLLKPQNDSYLPK